MTIETAIVNEIDNFIRNVEGKFTLSMVKKYLEQFDISIDTIDLKGFIKAHPYILMSDTETFITRAAFFSNKYFCIKPLPIEIELGILIPGHRAMPFTDPDKYPFSCNYIINNEPIKKIAVELNIADFLETNYLFGEEYIPQLLDSDPANIDFDIMNPEHTLPNTVSITAFDMSHIYKENNFSNTDRFLAKTTNWGNGTIELEVLKTTKENPFEITEDDEKRNQWQIDFSHALKNNFKTHGPLSSIEEQLANTFFCNSSKLFSRHCESIEESIREDSSIGISYYGVECRLWEDGIDIPAVGPWNDGIQDASFLSNTLYEEIGIPIPYYMLDAYIYDALYTEETEIGNIVYKMIPDPEELEDEQIAMFLLQIKQRYDTIKKTYNKFTDFEKGEARSRTLRLYSNLVELICSLDNSGATIEALPQQQLVILSQLFSHTTKFLDVLITEDSITKNDIDLIIESLDGMEDGYEDISTELNHAIANSNSNNGGFTII